MKQHQNFTDMEKQPEKKNVTVTKCHVLISQGSVWASWLHTYVAQYTMAAI